ncbi:LOW QUALITY PROTEIN: uncharacterized protein LOC136008873 [Lathamus discolor]|uniref:LOW QUALITY PROTEIN: uncharacterized protein LOC136008873 n=1 Tax=Lathamus discolor TaxID=678569 RepID=UPI0032B861E5
MTNSLTTDTGTRQRNYLQSEISSETDDHKKKKKNKKKNHTTKNQPDPELSLFSKNEVNSWNRDINQPDSSTQSGSEELKQFEDREVHLCNSFQPQSQAAEQETDTNAFCATGQSCTHKQLQENILAIGSKDMNQPPKDTKAHLCNYDSSPQLAEKNDSKIFCDKPARPRLLMTVSPVGSRPPPQFEEDTNTYLPNCKSQTAGRGTSETLYDNAGSYVSDQLVKSAVAAGSKYISILMVVLNGCDKILNYLST